MIDHTNRMRITCPYCGHEVFSSCDRPDAGDIDCSKCGRNYSYEREHIVTYTSYTFADFLSKPEKGKQKAGVKAAKGEVKL